MICRVLLFPVGLALAALAFPFAVLSGVIVGIEDARS